MNCTACHKPILHGQRFHRTKRGAHHVDCKLADVVTSALVNGHVLEDKSIDQVAEEIETLASEIRNAPEPERIPGRADAIMHLAMDIRLTAQVRALALQPKWLLNDAERSELIMLQSMKERRFLGAHGFSRLLELENKHKREGEILAAIH
jgi:hypothetical protein